MKQDCTAIKCRFFLFQLILYSMCKCNGQLTEPSTQTVKHLFYTKASTKSASAKMITLIEQDWTHFHEEKDLCLTSERQHIKLCGGLSFMSIWSIFNVNLVYLLCQSVKSCEKYKKSYIPEHFLHLRVLLLCNNIQLRVPRQLGRLPSKLQLLAYSLKGPP